MTLGKTKRKSGFSLMEFLIVIGIIAVLAVIIVPATVGIINKTNEQNDKVLASTYTEYMQKFATEKVGNADFYSTIYNDGAGSEYDILKSNSGLGSFPGITQLNEKINTSNEEEIWKSIRKEACIAIKAYGEVELADNDKYFVEKPIDAEMAFVYYYLTGKVEIKKVSDMKKVTVSEVNDGSIDTEDYWVFLDREGGSGKAVGLPSQKDFYVQIYQYGVENNGLYNEPINGVEVSVKYKDKTGKDCTKSAVTSSEGLLVFRDVSDTITITASREGAISYPDSTYYPVSETGPWYSQCRLPDAEYWRNNVVNIDTVGVGNSATNPFVIYLKMGTLGSLEFFETVKTYEYTSGSGVSSKTDRVHIIKPNNFITSYTKTDDSIMGRDESYESSTPGFNPLELLGVDESGIFKFLMYGDYDMLISNQTINETTKNKNFLDYNETITSDVYGIYNKDNPGDYPLNTSPYPYPVVLTRTDTFVQGTLVSEHEEQPLHGTYNVLDISSNFDSGIISSHKDITIDTKVYVVNKSNKSQYFTSTSLTPAGTTPDGSYIYNYEVYLNGQHTGDEYEIFLVTRYGASNNTTISTTIKRLNPAQWPKSIVADGSTYVFKTSTTDYTKINLQSDVAKVNFKIKAYEDFATNDKPLTYTATIQRCGYDKTDTTFFSASASASETNGIASFSNVPKGFYTLTMTYHDVYGGAYDNKYTIFVDEGNYVFVHNGPSEAIHYVIYCQPVTADGSALSGTGMLDGTSKYEKIKFNIVVDGVTLTLSTSDYTGGKYKVDYTSSSNNRVKIEFVYGKASEYLEVTQEVECFEVSDKSTLKNMLYVEDPINTDYNNTFKILRLENERTSTSDHVPGEWYWDIDNTNHWQVCGRCKYIRLKQPHFTSENVETGKTTDNQASYYASAYTSNNTSVGSQHKKHCTVCNLYDKAEYCDGGSWTKYYDRYTTNAAHSSVHTNGTGYTLKTYQTSVSTSRHYKYCSLCHQRHDYGAHDYTITTTAATCTTDGNTHYDCKYCDYSYDVPIPKKNHDYVIKHYYKAGVDTGCLVIHLEIKCSKCGDETKNGDCLWEPHTDDIPDGIWGAHRRPEKAKYFNWLDHRFSPLHDVCMKNHTTLNAPCIWCTDFNGEPRLEKGIKDSGYVYSYEATQYDNRITNKNLANLSGASLSGKANRPDGIQRKTNGYYNAYCNACGRKLSGWATKCSCGSLDNTYRQANAVLYYEKTSSNEYVFYADDNSPSDLANTALFVQNASGKVSLKGTFNNRKRLHTRSTRYAAFCQCCKSFTWPDDATIYNATDAKYSGKKLSCFQSSVSYRESDLD